MVARRGGGSGMTCFCPRAARKSGARGFANAFADVVADFFVR